MIVRLGERVHTTSTAIAREVRGQHEHHADYASPHLLGHPHLVQGDMREKCELAGNGIWCGDGEAYAKHPEVASRAPSAWRLLLQLESDEDVVDWMWGMTGRIYFWLRPEDLATRRFDRVWAVVQSG